MKTTPTILAPRPRKSVRLIASSIASSLERRCQSTPTTLPVRYRNPIVHHPFLPEPARPSSLSTTFSTKSPESPTTSMEELVKDMKRNGILSDAESDQKENFDWMTQMELEDVIGLDENMNSFIVNYVDESDAYAEFLEIISNATHATQTYQRNYLMDAPSNIQIRNTDNGAELLTKSPSSSRTSEEFSWPSGEPNNTCEDGSGSWNEDTNIELTKSVDETSTSPFLQASLIHRTQNPMPLNSPFLTRQKNGHNHRYLHHRHSLPKPKKQQASSSLTLPLEARQTLCGSLESDLALILPPKSSGPMEIDCIRNESKSSFWGRSRSLSVGDRPMPAAALVRL